MKNRPVKISGLNSGPVIPSVIKTSSQPMVKGRPHITIVNCRPLWSTSHPARSAPTRPPVAMSACKIKEFVILSCCNCNCNISTGGSLSVNTDFQWSSACIQTKHNNTKIHSCYINKSLYNFLNDDKCTASVTTLGKEFHKFVPL